MSQAIVGLELPDLQETLGQDQPAFRARQVYDAVYRQKVSDLVQITSLPLNLRKQLASKLSVGLPEPSAEYKSTDGTRRYLLKLQDNRTVEAVLMPEEGRDTICISSQVGCPVNCQFCLTALMGLERNLTAGEIVGQVLFIMRAHEISTASDRLNIVMMGMGEPLLEPAQRHQSDADLDRSGRDRTFAEADYAVDGRDHSEDGRTGTRAGAAEAGDFAECIV